jgi:hypothetical protein
MKAKDRPRITANKMEFVTAVAKYIWIDYKINEDILTTKKDFEI